MADYKYEIFNIDTQNMNYLQIRQWVLDCRNYIDISRYDNDTNNKLYQEKLIKFTDEWYEHYKNNKEFYHNYKYEKALLSLTSRPITVKAVINKKKIILNNIMSCITSENNPFIRTLEQVEESITKKTTSIYFNDIKECFAEKNRDKYKSKLDEIIKKGIVSGSCYEIKVFEKNTKARSKLLNIETEEKLNEILNAPDTFTDKLCLPKLTLQNDIKYKGYKELLDENSISSGLYSNFMSKNHSEKAFDKQLFVNIGFLLSLPSSLFNILLSYNGYSVSNSTRKFDEIIDKAFKLGYGRDITETLIEANNNILRKEHNGVCTEIPNIY